MPLTKNRTLSILSAAEAGRYGILAQVCYDALAAVAVVRAAERSLSPAIIMIFPVTMHWGGKSFLRYLVDLAHSAKVPIAVHLDHATTDEDIDTALTWAEEGVAFDSIMVDASHAETDEENLEIARPHIARAERAGVAVEIELGRLEGGEAGLRSISNAQKTDAAKADFFMSQSGATLLAPSIGNLHGSYVASGGPRFDLELLKALHGIVEPRGHFLAMHGTDELPDELFTQCVQAGATKINVNSWCRDPTMNRLAKGLAAGEPLPDIYEACTETYAKECERFFRLFKSDGRAKQ